MLSVWRTWILLLILPFCLSEETPDKVKLKFLAVRKNPEVFLLRSTLKVNCTTNHNNANISLFFQRNGRRKQWSPVVAIPGKVVQEGPVYKLLHVTRANKGRYQCRAWTSANDTVISVTFKMLFRTVGSEKPESKRPGSKKPEVKRKAPKKPGSKKTGSKKTGSKKLGPKRSRKRGSKRKHRPRKPGSRKHGSRKHGSRRQGKKRKLGAKKPKKRGKKKKAAPRLRVTTPRQNVTGIKGRPAKLKCVVESFKQVSTITWYRANAPLVKIGECKNKKTASGHFVITRRLSSSNRRGKHRVTCNLKVQSFDAGRDVGLYVCEASVKNDSERLVMQLLG